MGAAPTVDGGLAVWRFASTRSTSLAKRCTLKPTPTIMLRMNLILCGLVALRNSMARALPGRKVFLPILRSKLRICIVTSPKSILTGQGLSHWWHTVQ